MKMKGKKSIALINFHYAHNYGAVLQSLALYTFLKQKGYDVQVINYQPYYQKQYYIQYPNPVIAAYWRYRMCWREPRNLRLYQAVRWAASTLYGYRKAGKRAIVIQAFQPFVDKHLNQTQKYSTLHALRKNPPLADIYICGSDQIWNPDVTFGLDPAYFLDFGNQQTKRIAYAVSPCSALDISIFDEQLMKFLPAFDAISLRENEKRNEIEQIYKNKVHLCMDSTFLLSQEDYQSYEEPIDEQEPYILVYAFKETDGNKLIREVLDAVTRLLPYPVVDISLEHIAWNQEVRRRYAVTPGQFLSYCKNAKYIVTNSFHGTAFSIIYRKQFVSVAKTGTARRMTELMETLGMANALIRGKQQITVLPVIDYAASEEQITHRTNDSKIYLSNVVRRMI